MNFFDQKDVGNHPLKLCPKVVKHPVFVILILKIYHTSCKEPHNVPSVLRYLRECLEQGGLSGDEEER
jgi:hypothetical protein